MKLSNFVAAMLTMVILLSAAFSAAERHVPAYELHTYGIEKGIN